MQLLENRTKASRGEIEMVETLEELKELNKRKVAINFDHMLHQFDDERHTAAELDELDDELVIKSVFFFQFSIFVILFFLKYFEIANSGATWKERVRRAHARWQDHQATGRSGFDKQR